MSSQGWRYNPWSSRLWSIKWPINPVVRPKTNIAFKIPMWMYLKCRNKTKNNQNLIVTFWFHKISKINFKAKPLFSFKDNGIIVKIYLVKNLQLSVRKLLGSSLKNTFIKLVWSNEDRGGYRFIQDCGIRILSGSEFSNM